MEHDKIAVKLHITPFMMSVFAKKALREVVIGIYTPQGTNYSFARESPMFLL